MDTFWHGVLHALGIAGSLNVLGLDRVIITGYLSELPPSILRILS